MVLWLLKNGERVANLRNFITQCGVNVDFEIFATENICVSRMCLEDECFELLCKTFDPKDVKHPFYPKFLQAKWCNDLCLFIKKVVVRLDHVGTTIFENALSLVLTFIENHILLKLLCRNACLTLIELLKKTSISNRSNCCSVGP